MGYKMAAQIMDENADQVLNKVSNYLKRASYVNKTIQYQIDSGEIDIDNPSSEEKIHNYFKHYLNLYPDFVGVYYGDESGRFIYTKKMPDNSISQRIIVQKNSNIHSKWIHEEEIWFTQGFPNSVSSLEDGYDPRRRTWYKTANQSAKNIWSDVYIFSSDKKPGITNAQPIYGEDNFIKGVIGIDLTILDISLYLNTLDISNMAKIVILNSHDQIIALSGEEKTLINKLEGLPKITEFGDIVVREAYNHYEETQLNRKISSFSVDREKYVTEFLDFPSQSSVDWKIGIVLPEDVILGEVHATNRLIIYTAIILIIVSALIALKLASRITKPLVLISKNMKKIRKFDLEGNLELDTSLKELQEISSSFSNLKNGMRSFSKYVPSKVVARLVSMGREAVLGGERRKLTVFFSDIEGFTDVSENMQPEHLVEELAEYLGSLSRVILAHSGTVDKYIGDSIMAFWNAPDDVENHATLACETAIKIQQHLDDFNRNNPYRPHFPTRIGINTGEVLVGNIGSVERMNYTVMGDNINLGSRLESLNKYYGTDILVSETTRVEAGYDFNFRPLDKVLVKGKTKPIVLYELVGYKKYQTKENNQLNETYKKGLDYYTNSEWDLALQCFEKCLEIKVNDQPSKLMIERIIKYKEDPPADDWNGVYIYLNNK